MKCGLTFCDMDSVAGETCTLPNQRTFLGKKFGNFSAHELVADRLVAVWIQFVGVAHIPSSRSNSIIITDCLLDGRILGPLGIEGISIKVLLATYLACSLGSINLEGGIVWAINVRIDPQTEEMLMVVSINSWIDFCSPSLGILTWIHGVCVQDTCELDLQLNSAVLVEDPVNAVFVVRSRENVRDDEFPASGDDN